MEDADFNICGNCQSCIFTSKLHDSTQWMSRAGDSSKRRFLTGILVRCQSVEILETIQRVLQVTFGKDFTYTRSRQKSSVSEDMTTWSQDRALDTKLLGMEMVDTWDWFSRSHHWTKSNYLLGILSLCDTGLLHMLGNLTSVLIVRAKRAFLQLNGTGTLVKIHPFFMCLCISERCSINSLGHFMFSCVCEFPGRPSMDHISIRSTVWTAVTFEGWLLVVIPSKISVQKLFVSGLLDKTSLNSCRDVSQHWRYLTEDTQEDLNAKKMVEKQAMLMEDSSRVVHYSGGQLVAVGSKDRVVRLLDVLTLKEVSPVIQGHAGSIRALLLCEERGLVISASYDLSIRCWNLKTGVCLMLFRGHLGTINCLDLHGNCLVSGANDCKVKVWNLQTGRCYEKLKFRHHNPILCVKIDKALVMSSCDKGLVKMWGMETASLLKVIDAHHSSVKCLFFDQWHILSGGSDGQVMAWSTNCDIKKNLMTYRHPKEVLALIYLFLRVITGCGDGKIRIFNFLTGDCLRVIKAGGQHSPIKSLHTHILVGTPPPPVSASVKHCLPFLPRLVNEGSGPTSVIQSYIDF
uniref:F-box and WD repeat domain containing 10 n=1 Tax=Salmo trutta TaxID=8032 RepID=A0A673WY50_SALTR